MNPDPESPTGRPRILTVTEVTRAVREVVEGVIGEVWVEGEIANYRRQASGHQYFTLKDERCQLSCVLFFRPGLRHASIPLDNGMLVHVRGAMTVYEARGQYQMNVSLVMAAGAGLLAARFEALKRKLEGEGLFAPERKRALPRFPATIGIVTSPTGAAIADILNILQRRAPWMRVIIYPVRVQGQGAAEEIATGVEAFGSGKLPPVEVILVTRGGGSAEDLWEFNEERLARAIAASPIPVVSAVGHEIDVSISDLVADLRAPTPSAAAELIAPDSEALLHQIGRCQTLMTRFLREALERGKARLAMVEGQRLHREPRVRLDALRQQIDFACEAMARAAQEELRLRRERLMALRGVLREHRPDHLLALRRREVVNLAERFERASGQRLALLTQRLAQQGDLLRVLGPQATLGRGYSITRDASGAIIRSVAAAQPGAVLTSQVADGVIRSRVERNSEQAE